MPSRNLIASAAAALVVAGGAAGAAALATPHPAHAATATTRPVAKRSPAALVPAAHPTATGSGGSVASMDRTASLAGIDVLRRGGDAVDAAVATASALGVTNPFVAGPGGGGFMVIYDAHTHTVTTIDGRETCPEACTSTLFLDPKTHKPMDYDTASSQPLATGVPANVATWSLAAGAFGHLGLAADLRPAIAIARRGFRVNRDFRQLTESARSLLRIYPSSAEYYLTAKGNPWPLGHVLRNPDLAHTYSEIAAHGAGYLYDGPLGRAIVGAVDHPALYSGQKIVTRDGIMTMADVRAYRARPQKPTRSSYDGLDLFGMAPPSSSGTTIGEALNILKGFDLSGEARVQALYQYIEASRLAYADRDRYVGGTHTPVAALLRQSFADARRCLIRGRALKSPLAPGDPFATYHGCGSEHASVAATTASPEADETNNIVTTDRAGDIVAYTNTINFFGGSGETVPGYGFLLNNEMTDFDFAPLKKSEPDPNLPGPRKQPRSSMGPLLAFRDGRPQFAIGAAGGSTIPETILQTFLNHVDFGMSLQGALAAPRIAQTNSPTTLAEPRFYDSGVRHALQRLYGETFTLSTGPIKPLDYYPGDATAVQIRAHGRVTSIAEPYRLYGGSAFVVHPTR